MSQNQGQGWGPGQPPPSEPQQWAPPPPNPTGQPAKYCHACGTTIDARAELCPNCGVRQHDVIVGEAKSRPVAILLALLLGSFGVHRFYLGPIAWGIVYLIFFWTGIPGFIAWLEAIYFLTRSDADWARLYGGPVQASSGCAIGCLWVMAVWPLIAIILIAGLVFLGMEISSILDEMGVESYRGY